MTPAELNRELSQLTRQMAAGQLEAVEQRTAAILQGMPDEPRLLCLLGRVERLLGKRGLARKHLERAAQLAPRAVQVTSELGYLALTEEAYASAETHFERIVQLMPANNDALFNLGIALRQQGKHGPAVAALQRCLEQSTDQLQQIHTELGTAHIMQRNEAEALEHFQKALQIDEEYAPALHGVGMVRSAFGEFDEAAECFRAAMTSDPDFVEAYQQLVSIRQFRGADDPDVQSMEQIVADPQRRELTRETLHFALGKVYDDCTEFDRAFEHYRRANALKKARLPAFDVERLRRKIDDLVSVFSRDAIARGFGYANDSRLPIVVCGMPRSGTTLVEQVLASHSQVDAGGEQSYIERSSRSMLSPYPRSLLNPDQSRLQQMAEGYLRLLESCRVDGAHITDKMPANFMHIGLIHTLFPNARLIYCRRQRLDNALSIYFQNMPTGHHYANDLAEIDVYYREHERLMSHWLQLLGSKILTVDYEDMVGDFEAGARRLIDFCDFPWEDQTLDFRSRKGPVATLSLWQVRQPIYDRSVERWKNYASQIAGQIPTA